MQPVAPSFGLGLGLASRLGLGSALASLALASLTLVGCFDPGGGDGTEASSSGPGATEDGPASCVPGALQPCVCSEGAGNQECNAQGTAFGPCECVGGNETTGPSSTGAVDSTGPGLTTGPATGPDDTTGPGDTTGSSTDGGTTMGLGETGSGSSSGGFGPLEIGDECTEDAECMTGVCWNFNDYDPLCFGTACSVSCNNDGECVMAMAAAGAPDPFASNCGNDGRCTTLGTGFGAYVCAAAPRTTPGRAGLRP